MEWPLQRRLHLINKDNGSQPEELLSLVLEHAISATNATGAAIALSEGKEMICWAARGTAPGLGMCLDSRWGFSGLCVRKGRALLCEDAERDPRVDRTACRALGVRSIIAAPLLHRGKPVGVLEVLSTVAQAFDDNDIRELDLIAKMAIEVLAGMHPAVAERRVVAV